MKIYQYVDVYLQQYRDGKIFFNKERKKICEYIEREIAPRVQSGEIYFEVEKIEACIHFIERYFFPLQDFQKFLISFVFLNWKSNDRRVYKKFLWMMGRGAGKNGLISGLTAFLISPFHGIKGYNISIVANSEDQAKTSVEEVFETIEQHAQLKAVFKNNKSAITSKPTHATLRFRTSNGNTKDGLRDGAVVFDEIHQFEDDKEVRVHISGLGKRRQSRQFFIGTDGYIRDGFIDKQKEIANDVLTGKARFNKMFPFICKLDSADQVDKQELWELANPMLSKPLSEYAETLFEEIFEQYEDMIDSPSNREEFMTKRMNLPVTDTERSVATYEELVATKRAFPEDMRGWQCVGGLDFASIRDFAACGLLFRNADDYLFIEHAFARKEFVDAFFGYSKPRENVNGKRRFAPIREWEEAGWLTVVDEPSIDPKHVVDWFVRMRDEEGYDLQEIVGDNYRMDILREKFQEAGFEVQYKGKFEAPPGYRVEVLRNAQAIDGLIAPRIESAFANQQVVFGANDSMRWFTNNVLRRLKKDGNVVYEKKEAVRRKTDGFKAFQYAMYRADEIDQGGSEAFYEAIDDWFD
jgi:phage terminase large subunit-like protein